MIRIVDSKGNSIEVRDLTDGNKLIELRGKYGAAEIRLDAESAQAIGAALQPRTEEGE
jgi:hypothetical protein